MVLEARNTTQREIIKYTGLSGNTLTGVTRGQGGTSAKSHVAGALIQQNATAEDLQDLYDAFGSFAATNNDWRTLVATLNTVTYNGNRSYDMVFNGVDLTGVLSPGMRLRTERTVSAPTQCTSLNGTNQYYSKSSPAAMTFTDDFVVSAWVKLSSYPVTNPAGLVSRYNGTSGWVLRVDTSGQIMLIGTNAGSGNFSYVQSYQSIPLNKWVHVTAQLDMSTFTATTTTSYVMIDGVDVPASVSRSGTNPTALVQPTFDLQIGTANTGTGYGYFPGKIAQVAIYNAKVTQATIKASISQGLSGSETSLISAYSFNNAITDLSANANNLTANGAAVATNADSPFGGQASGLISATLDYGIIQSVSFSTNTTVVVQVPEGCTIPTSGGVSAVSYSTQKAPYGFPAQQGKWRVETIINATQNWGISALNVYQASATSITLPKGEWILVPTGAIRFDSSVSGTRSGFVALGSSLPATLSAAINNPNTISIGRIVTFASANNFGHLTAEEIAMTITTPTTYTIYGATDVATGSESYMINGQQVPVKLTANNAYL